MIKFSDTKTYVFENQDFNRIHIPRVYLNDFKQVSDALIILREKKYLNNSEMTEETSRIRAEHIREILIILWRLGCGINVAREGKSYCFKIEDDVDKKLFDEKLFQEFILQKLKFYNPFTAVLNIIKEKNDNKEKWNEYTIEKIFHLSDAKGNSDNIHPLIRWVKGFNLIDNNLKLVTKGIEYLKNIKNLNPFYFHENLDFNNNKLEIIFTEIFHQLTLRTNNFPYIIKKEEIKNFTFLSPAIVLFLQKNEENINETIENLIKNKLPLSQNKNEIKLNNPVFFDIKPKNYINYQLNKDFRESENLVINAHEKLNLTENKNLIIKDHNQKSFLNLLPKNNQIINYDDFEDNKDQIIDSNPKFIFLPKNWKPIKNLQISGHLYAYVKYGGNLIIIGGQKGRIGANMNMFSWLPYELTKINYLESKKNKYFKFTFGENLKLCKLLYKETIKNTEDCFTTITFSFFSGTITFISDENNIKLKFEEDFFSKKILINSKSENWINSKIIHWCTLVKGERKMYPILRDFMKDNFKFKFDLKILGHSGQTDLFMTEPFKCLFEVDTVGVNQVICGASKVSEVDRHYKKMKKQNYFKRAGKCVIAYEYSDKSGDDREGTIETAKNYMVNLVRYKDIYELSCIKDLDSKILKKLLFSYDPKMPELSLKLIDIYEKNSNF